MSTLQGIRAHFISIGTVSWWKQRLGILIPGLCVILGLIVRIVSIVVLDPLIDETQLLNEIRHLTFYPLPVHFYGFGWGEHVPLAFASWPLIYLLPIPGIVAIRSITLIAHGISVIMLWFLVKRWLGKRVALTTIAFVSLWPWSIITGVVGFNAFLLPPLFLGSLLCFEYYRREQRMLPLVIATLLLSSMYYVYMESYFWVPTILCILYFAYPKIHTIKQVSIICGVTILLSIPITLVHMHSHFSVPIPTTIGFLGLPALDQSRYTNVAITTTYRSSSEIVLRYTVNYLSHFSFIFLIFSPSLSASDHGIMPGITLDPFTYGSSLFRAHIPTHTPLFDGTLAYAWDVLFIPLGILALFLGRIPRETRTFLVLWLLLYPLGPSLVNGSFGGYTITRDIFGMPLLVLLSAYGFIFFKDKIIQGILTMRH